MKLHLVDGTFEPEGASRADHRETGVNEFFEAKGDLFGGEGRLDVQHVVDAPKNELSRA